MKIKNVDYDFPDHVSAEAREVISKVEHVIGLHSFSSYSYTLFLISHANVVALNSAASGEGFFEAVTDVRDPQVEVGDAALPLRIAQDHVKTKFAVGCLLK